MRNGVVDVCKFAFCIIICLYHFYGITSDYWSGGAIGVSYFVLVSVIFLLNGWERKKEKLDRDYPLEFFKKRFMRFFPYTTLAFISTFIISRIYINIGEGVEVSFKKIITWLSGDIWEILLVDMMGLNDEYALLNTPVWTISAMLLTEFIIIVCLCYSEDKFANIIAPISMMIGFGVWRQAESAHPKIWVGITTYGMIRVFVISCLGYYGWRLYKTLKATNFTKSGKRLLTVIELACYVFLIPIMYYFSSYNFYWVATLIMVPAIAISLSGNSNTTAIISPNKLTNVLGELSFSIFLSHYQVFYLFSYFWPDPYEMYEHIYLFLIAIIIVGVAFNFLSKKIVGCCSKTYAYAKAKIII